MADSTDMPQTDPTGNLPDTADADTVLVYGGGSKPRRLPRPTRAPSRTR